MWTKTGDNKMNINYDCFVCRYFYKCLIDKTCVVVDEKGHAIAFKKYSRPAGMKQKDIESIRQVRVAAFFRAKEKFEGDGNDKNS